MGTISKIFNRQIFLSFLFVTNIAWAGNEGGGGHECKAQFMTAVKKIDEVIKAKPTLMQKYPFLSTLLDTVDPLKNIGFRIVIKNMPIKDCPLTENALACGRPQLNELDLNCNVINGWSSLSSIDQNKQLIHELMWWQTKFDDSNYFYSTDSSASIQNESDQDQANKDNITKNDKSARLEKKGYFSKSILDSNDNYLGFLISSYGNVTSNDNKGAYFNLIDRSALWGLKIAIGSSDIYDESLKDFESVKYMEFGINKYWALSKHSAIEASVLYEKGNNHKAGDASIGLVAFTGNFLIGLEYKNRFAVKMDGPDYLPLPGGSVNLIIGVCF